jgi:hypothetical protein
MRSPARALTLFTGPKNDRKRGPVAARATPPGVHACACVLALCMLAILITPPTNVPGEAATLASLVHARRPAPARPPTAIHVRKPGWDRAALAAYVRGLDPAVRALVVLHSHHDLVGEFGLKVRRQQETRAPSGGERERRIGAPHSPPDLSRTPIHYLSLSPPGRPLHGDPARRRTRRAPTRLHHRLRLPALPGGRTPGRRRQRRRPRLPLVLRVPVARLAVCLQAGPRAWPRP